MAVDYVRRSADAYYRAQTETSDAVSAEMGRLMGSMDAADITGSWQAIRVPAARVVAAGQMRAASAAPYLSDRVLAASGLTADPLDVLPPSAFAGWTADGVDMQAVVDSTPGAAKRAILRGASPADALAAAQARLDRITVTEVQDAGRGALDAQMRLEPQIAGYERHVVSPSCSRCTVLAGRFYRKSAGFLRHPSCRCFHLPVTSREQAPGQDPLELFHQMTDAQQDAAFTPAGARAIRDGADLVQVVNARWQGGVRGKSAGMSRPGDPYTTAGTARRSAFYRQQEAAGRLTPKGKLTARRLSPQGVALRAGDDTVLYRRLLRENGYLI